MLQCGIEDFIHVTLHDHGEVGLSVVIWRGWVRKAMNEPAAQ